MRQMSRYAFIAIGMLLFIAAVYRLWTAINAPHDDCLWDKDKLIVRVDEGGTAERAGMKLGDKLISINGEPLGDKVIYTSQMLLNKTVIGEKVPYVVERNGVRITLQLEIVPRGFTSYNRTYLVLWIIGLSGWLLAMITILKHRFNRVSIFIVLTGFVFCTQYILASASPFQSLLFYIEDHVRHFFILPALILHLMLMFPEPRKVYLNYRKFISLLYVPPIVFYVLYAIDFHVPSFTYSIYGYTFYISSAAVLFFTLRYTKTPQVRTQAKLLLGATIITCLGLGIGYLFENLKLYYTDYMNYIYLTFLSLPLALGICVFKYQQLDESTVISKTVTYAMATSFVILVYFMIVYSFSTFLQQYRGEASTLFIVGSTILLAMTFYPLKEKIQHWVDKTFYRDRYNTQNILRDFGNELRLYPDMATLFEQLLHKLHNTMHVENLAIIRKQKNTQGWHIVKQVGRFVLPGNNAHVDIPTEIEHKLIQSKEPLSTCCMEIGSKNPEHAFLGRLSEAGVEMVIPFTSKNYLSGLMLLGKKRSDQIYSNDDLQLLQELANRAAVVIENTELHKQLSEQQWIEKEIQIAYDIQSHFMPEDKFKVPGLDIDTFALPAKVVGGDFWDLISFPEKNEAVVVIGDVSGKSISGAMVMAVSKGIIASQVQSQEIPSVILSSANRLLYQNMKKNMFVALTIAKFDLTTMGMQYAVAGLPFPFLYRENHGFMNLQTTASQLPLASLSEMTYTQSEITLQKNDLLLFTTDGLLEAMNAHQELYGVQRLETIVKMNHAGSPEVIRQAIISDVKEFVDDTEQFDDITIVTVKIS